MGTNPVRFRVESNKGKTKFWYTIVAGNGNTTMTSKTSYDDYDNAERAARRQVEALTSSPLVIEFERDGQVYEEPVEQQPTPEGAEPSRAVRQTKREAIAMPEPSFAVAESRLNPQF